MSSLLNTQGHVELVGQLRIQEFDPGVCNFGWGKKGYTFYYSKTSLKNAAEKNSLLYLILAIIIKYQDIK